MIRAQTGECISRFFDMKVREFKMLVKSSNELGQEEVESLGMVVLEGS